jgi:serine/threonine protein kinase
MTVAAGGELVLHFVVAASMQEAFAREGTTSSRSCVYRNPLAAPASRDQLLGMLVITRNSTERSIEDPVPRGVDREFVLVVSTTDDMSHINGFVAGNGAELFRTTEFARVRWYTATVGPGRVETVWWFGTSFTTLQNVIVDSLGLLAHATRTLDTIPDHKGTWLVRSAADTQFTAGAFTAYTVDEAEPSTQAQLSEGQWRTIDGSFNMRFHRSFGAAGNPFQRSQALTNPALPLPAPAAVADSVFFALPTLASLRRPLVSRLLNAFTGFVVADMADVTPDVAQASVCADASAGASNCTVRLYPTSAFARVERDAASVRATFERAIGLAGFDAAAIEREPLPAVTNGQTSWIDLSTIYGVTTAVNRRARTLRDGRLSTNIADWPLSSAPIEQLVLADLFVREHNRHAGALARLNASRSDDELFRLARELTIAAAQFVAAKEWLPTLTGDELPDYVASSDAVDNDNELLSGTAFRQVVLTSSDGHKADLRGDSSLTFALACAPALRLSVASESLTLRNDDLEPLFDVELGHLSASQCSGSAVQAARCFEFGVEPILRGLFADGAPAIGPRVIGALASLRAGDAAVRRATPLIDAATDWLIRGREALLPSFADLLRQSGRAVPTTFAALVGLEPLSNVTAELVRAQAALARGDAFDWRPLVARQLERAYPLGVEQLDALVGLLVEPPALPLSSSLGPTLASCVTQQFQRTRAADRLWFQNDIVNVTDLLPSRAGASLLRELIMRNYDFSNASGAPAAYPFYALRTSYSNAFALFGNAPDPVGNRTWQNTTQPLPSLRFSWVADETNIHVLLETPSESYVALGFGPRAPGTAMKGGDFVMLALRDNGAVVVRDSFGLFDQQEPFEDESVNGTADWFDVRAERSSGVSRYWLSRARSTGDKFDNAVSAEGAVETMFALGTVPLRGGAESDVLSTYHGQQRVTTMLSWPVRVVTATPTSAPPSSLLSDDEAAEIEALIGGLLAATAVLLVAVLLLAWFLVRRRRLASAAAVRLQELDEIVDGERVPVPDSVRECDLHDANFPLAVMNPSTGLFRDPVPVGDYDEATLKARREAQQNQQVPVRGVRLLAVDRAYADILSVMNVSDSAQDVTIYLPARAAQYKLRVDPAHFRLGARQTQAVKVTVALNCTTKQKFALRVGTARFVAALPVARVESELSTSLDYDEIQLIDRIGEGSFGVVFSGSWRKQPVAVKLLRQQQFAAHELSDLRAEAKFLSQLLHRNVVQFRGAVFRESQCCLVTELAPHGSLKVVVNSFSLPWDLVIKMAVDVTCGLQFLHVSGIIHRDVKSDNVLVFSLSPREAVCAKLTDFGSARAAKAHIDATGKVQLGADRNHSQADGTPIYMSPQLLAKTSRPSEASDCYALGCLFYEIASEREPWADLAFSWDVAKAVMAGKRPEWPHSTLALAPSPFVPLVTRMWSQLAEARPQLDDVLQELAACQEAIGDRDAAATTLANVRQGTAQTMDKGIALALATQSTQSRSYGSSGDVPRSGTQRTASTIGSTDSHDTPAAQHSDSGSNTSSLTRDSKMDYAMAMRLVPKVAPPRNTASVTSGSSGAGSTAGDSTSLASLAAKNVTGGVQSKNRTIGSAVVSGKNVTGGATNKNRTVGDNERQAFSAKNVTGGVVSKTRTLGAAELDAALAANQKSVATPTPSENTKTKKAKATRGR